MLINLKLISSLIASTSTLSLMSLLAGSLSLFLINPKQTIASSLRLESAMSTQSSVTTNNDVNPTDLNWAHTKTNTQNNSNSRWGSPHTGQRTSTGARNGCPEVATPLTAIVPNTNFGKTVMQSPTLWFYVPYSSSQIDYGDFILQDKDGFAMTAPVRFVLPDTPGLMSFTLPTAGVSLNYGEEYYWSFQLYCAGEARTPIYVEGWIQLEAADPGLSVSLDADSQSAYAAYLKSQIWFDAVNVLAQQRLLSPDDETLAQEWQQLLTDGGLDSHTFSAATAVVGSVILTN